MAQVTESDYRTAQKGNADVRQEFLDTIDLEDARKFIKRVDYRREGSIMKVRLCVAEKGRRIVYVGQEAFDITSLEEFSSALIDHEGYHARQFLERKPLIKQIQEKALANTRLGNCHADLEIFRIIYELPAYANQLEKSDCSDWKMTNPIKNYELMKEYFLTEYKLQERKKLLEQILLGTPGDELIRRDILSK
jgi:hypothetical protein